MSALAPRAAAAPQPSGAFKYARPKQFIAAQNLGPATPTPPMTPTTPTSPTTPAPWRCARDCGADADAPWCPSSPSPPPPPPPLSPTAAFQGPDAFPPPPPPPPLPSANAARPGQTPAAFLSALLPSPPPPPPPPVNALGLPRSVTPA